MDPDVVMLSEISQTGKEMYSIIISIWNLKNKTDEYGKTETDSHIQNKPVVTSVERKS